MRLRTRIWILLSVVLFVAAALYWRGSHQRHVDSTAANTTPAQPQPIPLRLTNALANVPAQAPDAAANSSLNLITTNVLFAPVTNRLAYRLTNTAQPLSQLLRSDRAVLLRNALIDTALGTPNIPDHLRAQGDPGSYIVQARGAVTDEFRAQLAGAGAEIISYVPNNAYLVRATAGVAGTLRASPLTQAVLPYEPYYKLDSTLLRIAVNKELSPYGRLTVVGFPGQAERMENALKAIGAEPAGESQATVFGPTGPYRIPADRLAEAAQIPEVQMLAVHYEKRPVNDLTRVITRISTNIPLSASVPIVRPPESHYRTASNTFLTGDGVIVAVADTGVDDTHPDLTGRILPGSYTVPDYDGHGTHVIGTFIGDGTMSPLQSGEAAMGSLTNAIFSGMAPRARAFVQNLQLADAVLQRRTAEQGALISNNSWGFAGDNDYDIFAAIYDSGVRDSMPGVTGEQEVAYVFAAGNEGGGGADGLNGIPGSIISPATGKNVITVGGSDLPRHITNEVYRCVTITNLTSTNVVCNTNTPWAGMTDTNNQVSPFSSRGNVGIGIEGLFGRFKPDVIAPGAMLVSTRSKDFVEPDGETNTLQFQYNNLTIGMDRTNVYALTIPPNAIRFEILTVTNLFSPTNLTLWIGAGYTAAAAVVPIDTNRISLDSTTSPALVPGLLYYSIANTNHAPNANYDLILLLTVTNNVGNYYTVLKQLNAPLKPYYRYEAGTSMAAPAVSGFLALVQEYLGTNFSLTNPSPALLKAMLINGARSLNPNYNLQNNTAINHQGWGLVNMSNSIPFGLTPGSTNGPMRFFDQKLTNSLATGGTETYEITVPNEAKSFPLRVTLVWSDPPGNPVTGIKLVNNMDLSVLGDVTNTVAVTTNSSLTNSSTLLWIGNNFPPGSDFTQPIILSTTDTNTAVATNLTQVIDATRDIVNNVENVYIQPPLSSRYTVVVKGHRVNVNAVNSHTNGVVQDYALVISSGNVALSNRVDLFTTGPVFTNDPTARIGALVRAGTNGTSAALLNQRVGANSALIVSTNGATNQWAFFTYTNVTTTNFTNVVILTFLPPNLSLARYRDADIDLYVSRGSAAGVSNLFMLDDNAISSSIKSTRRGGTEVLVFKDAQPDEVFYIGVKSEDQQAANFALFAASSDQPFSSQDSSNNIIVRPIVSLPLNIPDGTPEQPGGTNVFLIVDPLDWDKNIARVYVTNSIYHEEAGDLVGILTRLGGTNAVTLNNHRTWTGWENPTFPYGVIYDDSGQGDLGDPTSPTPVFLPDGPGRLKDYIGEQAGQVWDFTISDNAMSHTGYLDNITLVIEPASTNTTDPNVLIDRRFCVNPGQWVYAAANIPNDAFNMETCVFDFETPEPIWVFIKEGDFPDFGYYDYFFEGNPPGECLDVGLGSNPPLFPGRWYFGFYNSNSVRVCFHARVTITRKSIAGTHAKYVSSDTPKPILDDAKTNSLIFVPDRGRISDLRVGLRVDHERAADMVFHLTSPNGTRLLLMENRGRTNARGIGVNFTNVVTNVVRRVINNSFEEGPFGEGFGVGAFASGWRVERGDIDSLTANAAGPADTGVSYVDLNGMFGGGLISTNVATIVGGKYLLTFAFCKEGDTGSGYIPSATADVLINSNQLSRFTYNLVNSTANLNWAHTSFVFQATSRVTKVSFAQVNPPSGNAGMFIDTVTLNQINIETNLFIYTTFTENTNLTDTPIKFGQPPFTNGGAFLQNRRIVLYSNNFESAVGGEWSPATTDTTPNGRRFLGGVGTVTTPINFNFFSNQPPHSLIEVAFDFYAINSWDGIPAGPMPSQFAGPDRWIWDAFGTNVIYTTFANGSNSTTFQSYPGRYPFATNAGFTGCVAGGEGPGPTPLGYGRDAIYRMVQRFPHAGGPIQMTFSTLGLQPAPDEYFGIDNFVITALDPTAEQGSFYLPEEPITPFFGEQARGFWNLEVWDSRLGGAITSSPALVSWQLEIAFPQTNPPVIFLTNGQSITTNVAFDEVRYFAVDVPCGMGLATNTLSCLNPFTVDGLDMTFNQYVLPTNGPFDVLLMANVTLPRSPSNSVLTIGSTPLVSATRYYLAVFNDNPFESNQFRIAVNFNCSLPPLTNKVAYCTSIPTNGFQIFSYTVASNAVGFMIETIGANGNVNLYVKPRIDPVASPTETNSVNGGATNEFISFGANIGLTQPGLWRIGVTNVDTNTVSYCVRVTEIYDTNAVPLTPGVSTNQIVATTNYYRVSLNPTCGTVFFTTSGHVPASNLLIYVARDRIPSPLDYDLFGVSDGMCPATCGPQTNSPPPAGIGWFMAVINTNAVPIGYDVAVNTTGTCFTGAPVIKSGSASYSSSGFKLEWDATTSEQYQVQFTDTLEPAQWQTLTNIISSDTGHFEFLDTSAQTNAAAGQRFYRLLRVQ